VFLLLFVVRGLSGSVRCMLAHALYSHGLRSLADPLLYSQRWACQRLHRISVSMRWSCRRVRASPDFCFNAVVMQEGPSLFVDPSCQLLSRAYLQVYYKLNSCLGITEDRRFPCLPCLPTLCSFFECEPCRPQFRAPLTEVAAGSLPTVFAVAAYGCCSHSSIV